MEQSFWKWECAVSIYTKSRELEVVVHKNKITQYQSKAINRIHTGNTSYYQEKACHPKRSGSKSIKANLKQAKNQTQLLLNDGNIASPIKNLRMACKKGTKIVDSNKTYLNNYLQSKENRQMENLPDKNSERSVNRDTAKSVMSSIILVNKNSYSDNNVKKPLQPKLNLNDDSIDNYDEII